jgi:caffeoyl-CoA O-methyltransferase
MPVYNEELSRFITDRYAVEDEALRRARIESPERGLPAISVRAEEGRFLQLLTAAVRARKAVEIGTLGGYSGSWIARGLAPGGSLITIDVNEHHTEVARDHFEKAGLDDRVELLTGDGGEMLDLISNRGPFDFVFIDADKSGYPDYYEWAVSNVRSGGTICAHNAFRSGRILDAEPEDDTARFVDFLSRVANDQRVISTIYPAGDGTLVAVKK